jgi:hypothetical protein
VVELASATSKNADRIAGEAVVDLRDLGLEVA